MERIECGTKQEAEKKLWIASKELGEWGEKFFYNVWFKRHVLDGFTLEHMIYSDETPTEKRGQRNGVDFIETNNATGERHAYEVKTDLQSTGDTFTQNQNYYRTRPIDDGPSKLDRTKGTITPLMKAATGNTAEYLDGYGLLNYFIELKQEWGGEGWFPKLEKTVGKLDEVLPEYAPINGRDVVFIAVIDGEPLEKDKVFFADQDGNLPDGMRSGAGAHIILVPDDVLIRITQTESEKKTYRGYLLPMIKLFERKEADAYMDYWEGNPAESRHIPVLKVGKQANGVTVWPMEPLTIAERKQFVERVETKRFYQQQVEKFK